MSANSLYGSVKIVGQVEFFFTSKGKVYLVCLPAQDINEGFGFPFWRAYLNGVPYESGSLTDLATIIARQAEMDGKVMGKFYQHTKPYIIDGVYA